MLILLLVKVFLCAVTHGSLFKTLVTLGQTNIVESKAIIVGSHSFHYFAVVSLTDSYFAYQKCEAFSSTVC